MNRNARLKYVIAAAVVPLFLAGCFGSNPARPGSGDGDGRGGGTSSTPMPPTSGTPGQTGTQGQSRTRGNTAPNSTATAPESGDIPTQDSRQGSTTGEKDGGRLKGKRGGTDGAADVRVASVEKSGAGTNAPDAIEGDVGSATGTLNEEEIGVAEALEGANAAVDAASDAVSEAEAAIARARETAADAAGGGEQDSFDPWVSPGAGEKSADTTAGGGGQPAKAKGEGTDSASPGSGEDETAGRQETTRSRGGRKQGDDNFDPFADYGEQAGSPGQPTGMPKTGSLQIAEDAVSAAKAALSRARRALITAADAGRPGTGDADAEAVQLAAARAAMEAAAEAVIASAIAVMAAAGAYADDDVRDDESSDEDLLAEGIAKVVAVVQRDMRNAADALDATGELLSAAGSLMGMLGRTDDARQADEEGGKGDNPGERVADLEDRLDQSLAVFDDRMHAEGSSIVRGMGGEDSEITGTAADSGSNVDPNTVSGRTDRGTTQRGSSDGAGDRPDVEWNKPRNQPLAKDPERLSDHEQEYDIDDTVAAQDDDIIARQLREAAIAEQDPELREALWQEYKSYKESLETGEAEAN